MATQRQQAQQIDKAKEQVANISIDEGALNSIVFDALETSFDITSGVIKVGVNFIRQLNVFVNTIAAALRIEPKFTGAVSEFVKRIPEVKDAIDQFQSSQGINLPPENLAAKLIEEQFKEELLRRGLNKNFIQPLRDLIYRDALSGGLTLKDAKASIRDYVGSGQDKSGKLHRYVQQTAQQAVDAYSGIVSMNLMEKFKYDGLLMTGSLIDTSTPQCRYAINQLGGIITRKDIPKLEKIGKNYGWIEGTNFDNLPVNQLHWGCRHSFYPFVKN